MKIDVRKKFLSINLMASFAAVFCSLTVAGILIIVIGKDPFIVLNILLANLFESLYALGQIMFYATPLIFAGLSFCFAYRSGLFNIGAQGQIYMGALLCAWVGWKFGDLPSFVLVPICILSAMAGGGLWGFIPGLLKVISGASEVISTIMMNFIALALTNYIVSEKFYVSGTVRTPYIGESARLIRLGNILSVFEGSTVNMSIVFAFAAVIIIWFIMGRTRLGYELKSLGSNPDSARYYGINIKRNTVIAMTVSGAVAGMAGINFVMGYKYYFEQGFSGSSGFMGIAVALLAMNSPVYIIISAMFFGLISYSGLMVNYLVPKEITQIIHALLIMLILIFNTVFSRIILNRYRYKDKND
ncbi:ABC transporter permease [Elusimicrobiota bacterium]